MLPRVVRRGCQQERGRRSRAIIGRSSVTLVTDTNWSMRILYMCAITKSKHIMVDTLRAPYDKVTGTLRSRYDHVIDALRARYEKVTGT